MGGETHDVFLDAEDLEILQIHLVHGVELRFELLLGAVDVGVVHLERAHAHEAEEFAALLVAIAGAVFRETQRQIAITARQRIEELVMMRAVHRFEVVAIALEQLLLDLANLVASRARCSNLDRLELSASIAQIGFVEHQLFVEHLRFELLDGASSLRVRAASSLRPASIGGNIDSA